MENLLNKGQVLGRSEMKKIMAGSGYGCTCSTDECWVGMNTNIYGWTMEVYCDGDSGPTYYSGSGAYGGTACNGHCP